MFTIPEYLPFWPEDEKPAFLTRSNTVYGRTSLKALESRGLENRLLSNIAEHLPSGVFIAGGFMASVMQETLEKSKDIDFFFRDPKALHDMIELIKNPPEEAWSLKGYTLATDEEFIKHKSQTLRFIEFKHEKERPTLQLIKLSWFDSPEAVIDSFDLTVSQFATDGKDLIYNPISMIDLARKRLVLHRMQFPASTMRRIVKYSKKGYYCCPGSLTTIAEEIVKIATSDPSVLGGKFVYLD